MITDAGKIHIKRFMAGFVPSIARSIALGVGNAAENTGDTRLQFEGARADINLTSYDFANDRLVYKAYIPEEFAGTIYEIGLFSGPAAAAMTQDGSRTISTFDSDSEEWVDDGGAPSAHTTGAFSRIDDDSLTHSPAASQTKTSTQADVSLDFGRYSGADKFVFAYNVGNANTSNITFNFFTDSSNYFAFNMGTQTSGYKISEVSKSSAVVTGSPSWENITTMSVSTTSAASGPSLVQYDGVRIEESSSTDSNTMIAREVLTTPFIKENGRINEVEFSLPVNL